jgi:hypothetical protein
MTVGVFVCSGCGIENVSANNLNGVRHIQTGGKPSKCDGRYHFKEVKA